MDADEQAKQRFSLYQENAKTTLVMSGEYARWFISSLFLMHSAMIAAVVHEKELAPKWSVFVFGCGVTLALLGALFGFLNLQWATVYNREAAEALARGCEPDARPGKIAKARAAAICLVLGSGAVLIGGGILVGRQFLP